LGTRQEIGMAIVLVALALVAALSAATGEKQAGQGIECPLPVEIVSPDGDSRLACLDAGAGQAELARAAGIEPVCLAGSRPRAGMLLKLSADKRPGDCGVSIGSMSGHHRLLLGLPIVLNEASAADLEAISGIGPALAGRIVAYREEKGGFESIDELREVKGIGPHRLEQMRPYVVLDGNSLFHQD